jgi:UDP-N-acetylglucosamine--N-acetylmuramyl-(pentapeptide) pyrophosphoryl-undecaprenol N-acetylglucosamine transferase
MTPALAVADELASRGAVVSFVTTPSQLPRVAERFPAYALEMRGFERRLLARQNVTTLWRLAMAAPRSLSIVGKVKPHAAVGGGGYLSGPVVAAAALRRVPGVAIESDAHLGVANRLLKPFVKRLCLSFPIEGLGPPKFVVTGRPLSADQLDADPGRGRALLSLTSDLPLILVFGGSQGAQSLNRASVDAFARPDLDLQVVHVCGERNFAEVTEALASRGAPLERYKALPYTDELPHLMAAADLVVGRSGGSVAEIAALGRPAVLVPYPYATADHQRKNALWMERAGAGLIVDDQALDGARLGSLVRELLDDKPRLAAMAAASKDLGRPDATQRVADEVERLIASART